MSNPSRLQGSLHGRKGATLMQTKFKQLFVAAFDLGAGLMARRCTL
jgi:hypothetical protein